MRLDSANRSFLALMALALLLGMYVLCGAVGSVLVPLMLARISHDRDRWASDGGGSMLPVLLFIILVAVGLAFGARSIARQIVASSTTRAPCAWPCARTAPRAGADGIRGRVAWARRAP